MATTVTEKKRIQDAAENLSKKTRFSKFEIESLLHKHISLTKNIKENKLDRTSFRDLLHNNFKMTDDIIMDRIFRAFDLDNDNSISKDEWVKGLSIFLRGDLKEKMQFSFAVFDMNSDGFVTREEMFQLLKTCLVKQVTEEDPEEGVKDLVDLCLKKLDFDHDLKVSFEDFCKSVESDELLLECLGKCFPSREDFDHDLKVSFEDFCKSVESDELLLECLGKCFPSREVIETFEHQFFGSKSCSGR